MPLANAPLESFGAVLCCDNTTRLHYNGTPHAPTVGTAFPFAVAGSPSERECVPVGHSFESPEETLRQRRKPPLKQLLAPY
jgi:hypothetical protein